MIIVEIVMLYLCTKKIYGRGYGRISWENSVKLIFDCPSAYIQRWFCIFNDHEKKKMKDESLGLFYKGLEWH